MDNQPLNPHVRKGKFLHLEEKDREDYLGRLFLKISDGYFFSEKITESVVDELAPTLQDFVDQESAW